MKQNKKQREILKREKNPSVTKIAGYVGIPIHYARRYLEELKETGFVEKQETPTATYWRLK